jgi:membrane protein implicated in regulation of membrane protease activity
MEAWVIWLVAACALALGEMFSLSLYLAPFAVGALLAAAADLAGLGAVVQLVAFFAGSAVLFFALRPVARRHRQTTPSLRSGTAALVGRDAVVVERIANDEGAGCVKLEGEVWTARAYDADTVFEPGTRVQVMEIRGATALVSE